MKEINIGRVLIKNRHKRGITQDELANHLGVSKGAVSKWETGEVHPGRRENRCVGGAVGNVCGNQSSRHRQGHFRKQSGRHLPALLS